MTIHKSKGLEFPVVIIPNMDFTITMNNKGRYLMEVRDKILYAFPAKSQHIPELDAFAQEENNLILLDKMNLFYVGMTRPELRLYAINDFEKGKFGAMIHEQLEGMNLGMNDEGLLQIGKSEPIVKKEDSITNLYVPDDFSQRLWYPDIVFRKVFQEESEIQLDEQRFGNDFHLLMSLCHSKVDTVLVLSNLLREGQVELKNEAKLRESALAFWQKMEEGNYLLNVEKTLNEQVLLAGENDVKKPDKVLVKYNEVLVIDFKTGKIDQKHMEQIVAYGKLLEQIFSKPVRCILYYSSLNQLTEL
jgi:ATP-dependent exoDNAse (exonuclease V) beta subunit